MVARSHALSDLLTFSCFVGFVDFQSLCQTNLHDYISGSHPYHSTQTYFSGWTPLHFAAHNGFDRIVEILFQVSSIDINAADKDGLTPLFLATQSGAKSVFELILNEAKKRNILDAVVNARADDGSGVTPVFLCAQEGHLELLEMLVNAGAHIDIPSEDDTASGLMGSDDTRMEHLGEFGDL